MSYTVEDFLRDTGNTEALKFRAIELQLLKERREKEQILLREEQILLRERKERKEKEQFRNENEKLKKLLAEKGIDFSF